MAPFVAAFAYIRPNLCVALLLWLFIASVAAAWVMAYYNQLRMVVVN